MKRLRSLIFSYSILFVLAGSLTAAVPSSRPGAGAVPYDNGTTFRVWAPNASTMHVAGEFNSWSDSATPLAHEGNGWWSADISSASLGDEYRYVIDGTLWKTDPRARDVVSSVGNGVIYTNDYNWTPFTPPAWNEMVIYEMHIGSYYDTTAPGPGTWGAATSRLDHIQSLGVNAVKIMPVAEFPGEYSMGYNPVNLFAPESAYGRPDQMKMFIEQCHQRGIAVIIDLVYNHLGPSDLGESLWQFDGYSAEPYTGGIYFYENDNRFTPWGDTRPNYSVGEVRSFIRDNVMYWLDEYNLDGIRMDGTAYIRERGIGEPEIPEGWTLMQWINNEIDAAFPQKISIAEDMRDNEWITKSTGEGGAGFDSQWDASFHHKIVPALTASDDSSRNIWDVRDAVTHLYNGWDTQRVIYTESHDEVGSASGKSRVPEQIWPGNADSYYSKKRSTLGAAMVFTSPGIPMMFMGQEFLEDGSWHDDDPLDWSKDTTFAGIKQLYKRLIHLRRNMSGNTRGLLGKNVNVFHVNNSAKVIAFHRWRDGGVGDDVIVVANFSYQGFTNYNIGMPRPGRWRVRFNSDWDGYDSEFTNWNSYDANAVTGPKDGLPYNADVGVGPYSVVILSQGTDPDLSGEGIVDFNDFSIFAQQWLNTCNTWDACSGADFDMSGTVDMTDLRTFVSYWLEGTN
ncbi:1,4-alpha-glucan branching enzyme GlgB [Anaerohalosphaera lusitana]|uniref:1,4-alpha-glucan branching enzyme n=1 Tax=Anaerohalosphaera lusitana TaxID=1936003 RepID=A0A1U9NMS2_9BACT|nr:alpha-amylase family glycosyl hydrolase [Anaerohalosphaera lusitana]AQT69213.1 1,4-alpha-glucan branching enzyme GlgB [Anaerohalosphaera lusitana]